jgi:hypothetical protein
MFPAYSAQPDYVTEDEVQADARGLPILDRRLFLLDLQIPETEIRKRYRTCIAIWKKDGNRVCTNVIYAATVPRGTRRKGARLRQSSAPISVVPMQKTGVRSASS